MAPGLRLVAEACRERFGVELRPGDVERTELRRQWRSVVSLVRVGGGDAAIEMVEKRSRTRSEARFYRFAAARAAAGSGAGVVPAVYAVDLRPGLPPWLSLCSTVLMERLVVPRRARVPPGNLARAIAGIADLEGFAMPAASGLSGRWVRRFVAAAGRRGQASGALGRMARVVPEVLASPAYRGIPLVPCHNDVHSRNCGFRTGDATRPVLLDWESLAMNRAGSDLHHLVKLPAGERYLRALVAAYDEALAPRHAVGRERLELAACAYALRRGIARYLRQPGRERRRFDQVVAVFERLETLAERA